MYLPEGPSTSYSSWGPGWWVEVSLRVEREEREERDGEAMTQWGWPGTRTKDRSQDWTQCSLKLEEGGTKGMVGGRGPE